MGWGGAEGERRGECLVVWKGSEKEEAGRKEKEGREKSEGLLEGIGGAHRTGGAVAAATWVVVLLVSGEGRDEQ